MNNLPKYDLPTYSLPAQLEESQKNVLKISEGINKRRREEEAMAMRSLQIQEESLQIQSESNETQKLMLFLMQCVNKDNKEIIGKLGGLINSIDFGNKIEECNLLLIQKDLEDIKQNSNDLQSDLISAAKQNLIDKGVDYTIMFILQALKILIFTL